MKFTRFIIAILLLLMLPVTAKDNWPPKVGRKYPALTLLNQDGKKTSLSSFKGKIILLEPIGMNCAACNAFADKDRVGGFKGFGQQRGLPSITQLAQQYGRVSLPHPDVVVVHLLLYDDKMKPPSVSDAKAWAKHFGMSTFNNEYVLVGRKKHQVFELVPGFQLIDRDFTLISDGTGHNPKHNIYNHTFPKLGQLVNSK